MSLVDLFGVVALYSGLTLSDTVLTDDQGLCGAVCVWISKEKRDWISGRYICATWDMDELESKKEEIVKEDKLKWRMAV